MIAEQRISDYLDSLNGENTAALEKIRAEAVKEEVPVIRRDTENFLRTMICALRPLEILEVGTGVAYSALIMAAASPEDTHITTIENYEPRIPEARKNIRRAKAEKKISLIALDADLALRDLKKNRYDLIFMDAAKGQYLKWFSFLFPALKEQGVLISDNVLQDGLIAESRFAIDRRDRTIHKRMREYLYVLTHTEGLVTSIIPVGDGVAVSVKNTGRGE